MAAGGDEGRRGAYASSNQDVRDSQSAQGMSRFEEEVKEKSGARGSHGRGNADLVRCEPLFS